MLVRFFLSFFIFLLSSYSQMHAHLNQPHAPYSENCTFSAEPASLPGVKNDKIFDLKSTPSTTETEGGSANLTKAEDEVEDDELSTSKKYLAVNNYFTTVFFDQASRFSYKKDKTAFPFLKNPPTSFSCRYITFCNLRI